MKRILYPTVLTLTLALFTLVSFSQPYNIFGAGTPANPEDVNPNPIEVGTKFYVTQAGEVTAFRIHRGTTNTGTYIGHLWTNTGTLLATENLTGLSAGWNTVTLSTPVTVTPGNFYIVSYYSSDGTYGFTNGVFNSGTGGGLGDGDVGADPIYGIDRLNDPQAVGNGVFIDNPTTVGVDFPNTYFFDAGTAYYADVELTLFFPLPVTLTDFKAVTNNKNVDLTWKTQSESNNKGFEIQRSNNNQDWYSIGFVNGVGNSTTERSYSFTDRELAPGRYYYRLSQQDFDGNSKASNTVTALLDGKGKTSLFQNTPNPVRNLTTIRYDLPELQRVRLSIVDLMGREIKVLVSNSEQQAGSHIVTLDAAASGLSRQTYIIRLQTDNETLTSKMIVE